MLDEALRNKDAGLIQVGKLLKEKFIGIDEVINQFIDSVRVWYLMPELMMRPVIVNLWGLTGSGKTDLVRTFVKLIKMSDSFVELQMDIGSRYDKVQSYIEFADLQPDKPSILLLDEIQRFRTIDEMRKEIEKKSLQDVWMLLSDGRFQSASDKKAEIVRLIFEDLFYYNNIEIFDEEEAQGAEKKDEKKERVKKYKYKNPYWLAKRLKKLLNFQGDIEEVMQWDQETKLKKGQEALNDDSTFEGASYSKMLIIVAGNIDEAYTMSDDVSNADTDADVFHAFSKRINIITIKDALSKRFKPEQVARFGNNHIIYPSLSKDNYQSLIRRTVQSTVQRVYDLHRIKVVPDDSVFSTIYQNGVFPAQGVRPVLSTVSSIFDSCIPTFLFKAIEKDVNVITVSYVGEEVISTIGDETVSCKVVLPVSKVREGKSIDETVLTSIHEAGHILAYALLFRTPPTQMKSVTSNLRTEGFIGLHKRHYSKGSLKNEIVINLAGQAAEEIFFGDESKSTGAMGDITQATKLAAFFVRLYGFDGIQSRVGHPYEKTNEYLNTDIGDTNVIIENMLKEGKKEAIGMINNHKPLFKDIAQLLIDCGEIQPEQLISMFEGHGEKITLTPLSSTVIASYKKKWDEYK